MIPGIKIDCQNTSKSHSITHQAQSLDIITEVKNACEGASIWEGV